MSLRTLSHEEARRAYDRIGSWQDSQAFYEDFATRDLVRHCQFESAQAVFEFGCGTGRFARRLLKERLAAAATYRGVDVSPKMIRLARAKLAEFGERAQVILSDGAAPVSEPTASVDRFVSNYVFDLLSESDIAAVLAEAHRMLRAGGRLCLTGLSPGHGVVSRAFVRAWSFVHQRSPLLVGGCRPIDLLPFLEDGSWKLLHHRALAPMGIPCAVVVAELQPEARDGHARV